MTISTKTSIQVRLVSIEYAEKRYDQALVGGYVVLLWYQGSFMINENSLYVEDIHIHFIAATILGY